MTIKELYEWAKENHKEDCYVYVARLHNPSDGYLKSLEKEDLKDGCYSKMVVI